jgi:hypothetical protein
MFRIDLTLFYPKRLPVERFGLREILEIAVVKRAEIVQRIGRFKMVRTEGLLNRIYFVNQLSITAGEAHHQVHSTLFDYHCYVLTRGEVDPIVVLLAGRELALDSLAWLEVDSLSSLLRCQK